eukprot:CAMPEP_0197658310 /NCGR_PEP_ID=MMETSP1338-20131121/45165_1 /TAXON_ID=43686 ORGANISM="Pelagodinium beii, Strain RCC1491" /NCGR_SAMPLE_ID=MMETSP1338 /ASSEMBLY_ACC=CAM_ASM_000754 /LENGTH=252 /DNA_ID=CAMNT_0043234877 /DNA_START=70 /DNA_END=828 /DNA_ORIENTATION=+
MVFGFISKDAMKQPLIHEVSPKGHDKHEGMVATITSKALTTACAAEEAVSNGAKAMKETADSLEAAMKQGVTSAKCQFNAVWKCTNTMGKAKNSSCQHDSAALDHLLAMGFSEKSAIRALERSGNDLCAASNYLYDLQSWKQTKKNSKKSKASSKRLESVLAEARLAEEALRQEFDFRLALVRSVQSLALHQAEELAIKQSLVRSCEAQPEPSPNSKLPQNFKFLPSTGTWLKPLPLKPKLTESQRSQTDSN